MQLVCDELKSKYFKDMMRILLEESLRKLLYMTGPHRIGYEKQRCV